MISISKTNNIRLILLWLGVITIFILLVGASENKLSNIENKINNYKQQILETKVEQYDIENKGIEEYKKNEEKLMDLYVKYNDEVSNYNNILKKDKEKFVIFRWYFDKEELNLNDFKVTTEFIAPDFYKG